MSTVVELGKAVQHLLQGEVIGFPAETVYGLGADAANAKAVAKVFALKGRPRGHPLIVHIVSANAMGHWAQLKRVKPDVKKLVTGVAKLDVPLVVEAGVGDNWEVAH